MFNFFKKIRKKRTQAIQENIAEFNNPIEEKKVSLSLDDNIAICKELFSDMDIIQFKEVQNEKEQSLRYYIVFCDGMTNLEIISNNIIRPLMICEPNKGDLSIDSLLASTVQVSGSKTTDSFKCVVESVTSGNTVLFADGCNMAAVLYTKDYALRAIDEPENEKVLGGPREGFTESLTQNLSQVIRRAHTNELKTKMLTLGKRTKTTVCVCYFDSLADKTILDELFRRLNTIEIDAMLDANYITEIIGDHRYSHFRTTGYTERPDVIVGKLLEGRIAIFVDGSPMVLTIPYLFIENFQSNEDYYFNFYYTSFSRLLRIAAFILTIAVPGLYIAVAAFHQEMMPLQLLIRIAQERQSVPLPASIEAVIMLNAP